MRMEGSSAALSTGAKRRGLDSCTEANRNRCRHQESTCGVIRRRSVPAILWAFFMFFVSAPWASAQRLLLDTYDEILAEDIDVGGQCVSGCSREIVSAVAAVSGETDCDLRVMNLLDHIDDDVEGGTLNIVHSCIDENLALVYQGVGDCQYELCVQAEWGDGRLSYTIGIEHEVTSKPHSVRIQVYMNLRDTPSSSGEDGSSAALDVTCSMGDASCPAISECGASEGRVEIQLEDEAGDGWIGGLPDQANTWTITKSTGVDVADGTLEAGQLSKSLSLCLESGTYTFATTANAAWSSEATWSVCGGDGKAGGSLGLEVDGGTCSVVDDSAAGGPPDTDAVTSSSDYCSLPSESPCTDLDNGMSEQSGPSVGMYYDEACLEGGGGLTGCGGGGEQSCRVCFINRSLFLTDFPDKRYPDWVDCPCCVANAFDVQCQGGLVETEPESETILEKAEAWYWDGGLPVFAALGGAIGICCMVACCITRSISKDKKLMASTKRARASAIYDGYNIGGDTSPDISPPLHYGHNAPPSPHKADATGIVNDRPEALLWAAEEGRSGGAEKLTYSNIKPKNGDKKSSKKKRDNSRSRDSTEGGNLADRAIQEPKATAIVEATAPTEAMSRPPLQDKRRRHSNGFSAPPDAVVVRASRGEPPREGSWSSEAKGSVHGSATRRKPRWSGGMDAKAFMGAGAYDQMAHDDDLPSPPSTDHRGSLRLEGSLLSSRGPKSIMQALRSDSSRRSDSKDTLPRWVDEPTTQTAAEIAMSERQGSLEEIPLGDLPVFPPPPAMAAPVPAQITSVFTGIHRRSGSKDSRGSRSRRERSSDRNYNREPLAGSGMSQTARSRSKRSVVPTDEDENDDGRTGYHVGPNVDAAGECWPEQPSQAPPPPPPQYHEVDEEAASAHRSTALKSQQRSSQRRDNTDDDTWRPGPPGHNHQYEQPRGVSRDAGRRRQVQGDARGDARAPPSDASPPDYHQVVSAPDADTPRKAQGAQRHHRESEMGMNERQHERGDPEHVRSASRGRLRGQRENGEEEEPHAHKQPSSRMPVAADGQGKNRGGRRQHRRENSGGERVRGRSEGKRRKSVTTAGESGVEEFTAMRSVEDPAHAQLGEDQVRPRVQQQQQQGRAHRSRSRSGHARRTREGSDAQGAPPPPNYYERETQISTETGAGKGRTTDRNRRGKSASSNPSNHEDHDARAENIGKSRDDGAARGEDSGQRRRDRSSSHRRGKSRDERRERDGDRERHRGNPDGRGHVDTADGGRTSSGNAAYARSKSREPKGETEADRRRRRAREELDTHELNQPTHRRQSKTQQGQDCAEGQVGADRPNGNTERCPRSERRRRTDGRKNDPQSMTASNVPRDYNNQANGGRPREERRSRERREPSKERRTAAEKSVEVTNGRRDRTSKQDVSAQARSGLPSVKKFVEDAAAGRAEKTSNAASLPSVNRVVEHDAVGKAESKGGGQKKGSAAMFSSDPRAKEQRREMRQKRMARAAAVETQQG